MEAFEDIYISDATVLPGVRPAGRSTNNLTGRKKNGLLYIWSGEAVFWECSGQNTYRSKRRADIYPQGLLL